MENIKAELSDIQGLLIRAYGYLPETYYVMLRINDVGQAKKWLTMITDKVTPATEKPEKQALHIAFTFEGIKKLLPVEKLAEPFSREFAEDMVTEARSRILGDVNENRPDVWFWNGKPEMKVHMILMIFAHDKTQLQQDYKTLKDQYTMYGIEEVIRLDTTARTGGKEHFGFQDGIAQPLIKGLEKETADSPNVKASAQNTIMPGEFIFGFKNEYDKYPFSPSIKLSNNTIDIGKNGSYMVFRQLEQDVKAFWQFMEDTVKTDQDFADKDAIYVASKMMGRWPNGNPLHLVDNPAEPQLPLIDLNNFLFKEKDPDGFGCPIGSHVRKSNPRDGIDSDPVTSIAVSKRHRILRRGRPYGEPLADSMNPQDMISSQKEGKRGLYFICFNTNVSRQFEFIQHTWNNNPKFDGLYNDIDPIIGFPFLEGEYKPGEFTIPHCPVRKKVKSIPQFVFMKGGAYFFMPGIKTLKLLGTI